jgi:hypothetical protein
MGSKLYLSGSFADFELLAERGFRVFEVLPFTIASARLASLRLLIIVGPIMAPSRQWSRNGCERRGERGEMEAMAMIWDCHLPR